MTITTVGYDLNPRTLLGLIMMRWIWCDESDYEYDDECDYEYDD